MPAVATIVLADGQATPVNHSFIPAGQDAQGVWWFEDQSSGNAVGFNRISIALVRPGNPAPGASSENRLYRVKVGLHMPVLDSMGTSDAGFTPAPRVAYIERFTAEWIIPERASQPQRYDLWKFSAQLGYESQISAMVQSLIGIY